jgi:geranylgeranyl diphosphate synthase, type II
MDAARRIEDALEAALATAEGPGGPPRLAAAMRDAVFPGGARVRSRLTLAVAAACGDDAPEVSDAAAAAIEILHCASLVHDDLPCFDDAPIRRGKPSVHAAFGQPLAVLAGDALIVLAFETIAHGAVRRPGRIGRLVSTIGAAVGAPHGICAGQAWECEPSVPLALYQRAKTGALFAAATAAGAAACGRSGDAWRPLGLQLGEAFQVADDIRDVFCTAEDLGKPINRDAALGRPNAAAAMGLPEAILHLKRLLASAVDSIPPCPGAADLRRLIVAQTATFLPKELALKAA